MAVPFDLLTDVVASRFERQRRKRSANGDERREIAGVPVDGSALRIAGNRHHLVGRQAQNGAFRPEVVEVGIRVRQQRLVAEKVDRVVSIGVNAHHRLVP